MTGEERGGRRDGQRRRGPGPGSPPADGLGPDGPRPQQYEIWVRGHLGATLRAAFPSLRAQRRGPDTALTGPLPDQAALHGVLAEIEALGLELLEVRRLPLRESS
jgi:hypothetical protein